MCSAADDPTYWDALTEPIEAPRVTRPRTYRLSGTPEPRVASVALAVLGDLLSQAEDRLERNPRSRHARVEVVVLRRARDRVAAASA